MALCSSWVGWGHGGGGAKRNFRPSTEGYSITKIALFFFQPLPYKYLQLVSKAGSHLRAILSGSPLEPLHPPAPLLLPLQHDRVPLHDDGAPLVRVPAEDEVGRPRADLGAAALVILAAHPQLQRPALLHVPHLGRPPEGGVQARLELEPLAVVADLLADVDEEDVVLAAVLPHVHLARGLGALAAAGARVVLRVAGVVAAALLRGVAAVALLAGRAAAAGGGGGEGGAGAGHLDAGRDGGAGLLVTLGTPVTLLARDPVLAGALPAGLLADLAAGAHRVAVAGAARLLVRHRLLVVPEVALLAVVAVPPRRVVTALEAHPARHSAGQLHWGGETVHR